MKANPRHPPQLPNRTGAPSLSKTGMILCVLYAAIIALCWVLAFSAGIDAKGKFVFLQLPLALQMAGLYELGARSWLMGLSLPKAYLWIGLPTFIALYGLGWGLGGAGRWLITHRFPSR